MPSCALSGVVNLINKNNYNPVIADLPEADVDEAETARRSGITSHKINLLAVATTTGQDNEEKDIELSALELEQKHSHMQGNSCQKSLAHAEGRLCSWDRLLWYFEYVVMTSVKVTRDVGFECYMFCVRRHKGVVFATRVSDTSSIALPGTKEDLDDMLHIDNLTAVLKLLFEYRVLDHKTTGNILYH
ncbi:hypothetical protein BX666DRAFT_1877241 [Dichotomocladium elegans]|nr:hypothetical protein BX666DRAFT_1877241 [Dichotomocladium elegans]